MKYFTIKELTRSGKAIELKIDNTPPKEIVTNLTALVDNTLDPLRTLWGKPLKVNSGYRCPRLNTAIGGATKSAHLFGYAADITAGSKDANKQLWEKLINSDIPYTKVINEMNFSWIHIAYETGNVSKIKMRGVKINGVWKYYNV